MSEDIITDGLKHDGGKPRLDLVPPEIIEAVGAVMTHGIEKYGEGSYRNVDPKRYRAALMRHICKWLKNPYGIDSDSGLPHLWHIACNVAFLLELDKEPELHFEFNGRPLADLMKDETERLLQSVNGTKKGAIRNERSKVNDERNRPNHNYRTGAVQHKRI